MWRNSPLLSSSKVVRGYCCLLLAAIAVAEDQWADVIERYNPLEKPANATEVQVNMYIRSIRNLDSNDHSFQAQITFRQKWNEPRLAYEDSEPTDGHRRRNVDYQTIDRSRIWKPDTFFSSELDASRHAITMDNSLVRVFPNGDILMSERLSLKLSCPMNLQAFPFDSQVCSVPLASYGHTTESLIYIWKEGDPVQISTRIRLPEFHLSQFSTDYCTSRTNTGEYSCLRVDLTFQRVWNYYVLHAFVPITMLCLIAWLTFWVSDTSMRITMLMFTFTLVVLGTCALNYSLPRTGYPKTIDHFTGIGISFVLSALVEFVTVKWLEAKQEKANLAERVNSICRIVYPIAYIVFVVFYFLIALTRAD